MKHNVKLDDITKKYPFMYEINDDIYCIGYKVFHRYTNPIGVGYFKQYQDILKELDITKFENNELNDCEYKDLVKYYKKVLAYSEIDLDNVKTNKSVESALEFLYNLDQKTQQQVLSQLNDYICAFHYYSRDSIFR